MAEDRRFEQGRSLAVEGDQAVDDRGDNDGDDEDEDLGPEPEKDGSGSFVFAERRQRAASLARAATTSLSATRQCGAGAPRIAQVSLQSSTLKAGRRAGVG